MRPQRQAYGHNEAAGVYGDCHRTCIAMVLDIDRDDVPHFMDGVPAGLASNDPVSVASVMHEREWLAERGLVPVNIPFPGEVSLDTLLDQFAKLATGTAVILGCTSHNGFGHSVVIHDGKVYNPNGGGRQGVVGPMSDPEYPAGYWWVTILARATNPLCSAEPPVTVSVGQETN